MHPGTYGFCHKSLALDNFCYQFSHSTAVLTITMGRNLNGAIRKLMSDLCHGLSIEGKKTCRKQKSELPQPDNLELKSTPFEDNYTATKIVLGRGLNGAVVQCVNHQGKSFALKIIKDSVKARQEVSLHTRANDCDRVVKIVEVYVNVHKDVPHLFIVMECMEGGELYDYLKQVDGEITEKEAAMFMKDICTAVKFIHDRNIVHRDLKLENLLLTRKNTRQVLKLTDFGFAKEALTNTSLKSPCYSPYYVAPEVLNRQKYGKSCDIWSLGVILYIMLGSSPPFCSQNGELITPGMENKIKRGDFQFPSERWTNVSEEAKELIKSCLEIDTDNRINIDHVLGSKWINKFPDDKLCKEKVNYEKKHQFILKDPKMSNSRLMMKRMDKTRTENF